MMPSWLDDKRAGIAPIAYELTDLEIEFAYRALAYYRDDKLLASHRGGDSQALLVSLTSKLAKAGCVRIIT